MKFLRFILSVTLLSLSTLVFAQSDVHRIRRAKIRRGSCFVRGAKVASQP